MTFIALLEPTLEVISIEVSQCAVFKIIIKLSREKLAQFRPPTTFKDVILMDYWLDKIKEAQNQYSQKVEVSSMKEGQGSTIPSEVPPKLNVTLVDYWMPKTKKVQRQHRKKVKVNSRKQGKLIDHPGQPEMIQMLRKFEKS